MTFKTGIYKVTDGEFHANWQGVMIKLVHYIKVNVISDGSNEVMFLSKIKEERYVTLDGTTVDHVETNEYAETSNATAYNGTNMDDIQGFMSIGFVNPNFEWVEVLH